MEDLTKSIGFIIEKRIDVSGNLFQMEIGEQKKSKTKMVAIVILGLIIGAVNGLFGAGGGMLVVPVLSILCGLEEREAHATAIAIILPLCAVGSMVYFFRGTYDYSMFPYAIFGVISGGIIGAFLLKKASNNVLKILFYGVMLLAGFKMLI